MAAISQPSANAAPASKPSQLHHGARRLLSQFGRFGGRGDFSVAQHKRLRLLCDADIKKFCAAEAAGLKGALENGAPRGEVLSAMRNVHTCMLAHLDEVSPQCAEAISSAQLPPSPGGGPQGGAFGAGVHGPPGWDKERRVLTGNHGPPDTADEPSDSAPLGDLRDGLPGASGGRGHGVWRVLRHDGHEGNDRERNDGRYHPVDDSSEERRPDGWSRNVQQADRRFHNEVNDGRWAGGDSRAIAHRHGHSMFWSLAIMPFFCVGVFVTIKAGLSAFKKRRHLLVRADEHEYVPLRSDVPSS